MAGTRDKNRAYLTVGTVLHEGWKSLTIERSIEQASASFTMSLTESWPGEPNPIRIKPGMACKVEIGNESVITGYVDSVEIGHDANGHEIVVSGRSKTADLIDCSCVVDKANPGQFKNRTIKQIAEALAKPYNVEVVCGESDLPKIPKFSVQTGETVFAAIERLAREEAMLVTDDRLGRLLLTRLGDQEVPGLIHPGNILLANVRCDASQRFSEYIAKGQRAGDDENFGELVSGVSDLVTDPDIERRRVMVLKVEKAVTKAEAKKRAVWEAVTRAGKSAQVEVVVNGWRASDGLLWEPNAICRVTDPVLGVDGQLLIVSVRFSLDEGGQLTSMVLAPPGAYTPEMPKAKNTINEAFGVWIKGKV